MGPSTLQIYIRVQKVDDVLDLCLPAMNLSKKNINSQVSKKERTQYPLKATSKIFLRQLGDIFLNLGMARLLNFVSQCIVPRYKWGGVK